MTTTALRFTSSREADARRAIATVQAAGRVQAARLAFEAQRSAAAEQGQSMGPDGEIEFCFICSRCTDHWGEHSPEQIAAWKAARR